MAWIERVFSADGFMPHGHCYLWEPHILWLHLISDAVIGLSYFSIPVVLMLFSAKRGDLKLNAIFYAFSAFILACGLTHLSSIATIWYPYYLPQGLLKGGTAAISLATASVLWLILPRLVALPSPARLAAANEQLANEIALRREMEAIVKSQNQDLRAGSRALAMRDHALAQAAAAIAIADLTGEITYCNQSFADLIGLAGPDEAVGLNALQFAPDGEAALGQLLQNGRWIGEVQVRRPDGSVRETAVAASMVDFGDSSPHRIIASFMDVTDQREVQRALAKSEARLANAQRLARMGNWEWDIAADQFSWSDEVRALFSMADDADSGGLAGVLDYVHPDDRETLRTRLNRCLAGPPGTFSMDYRVPRPDGSVATIHGQAETLFDADGKAIRMTGTVQDISDRVQAEAASRRTEAFLDLIVENIPAMLFVKDAQELRFVTLNRAGEDLLGYDRTELIGRNDRDFFPPDQADAFIRADRAVIAAGRPLVIPEEAVNTRHQGQRLLRTIKIPVHDEAGAPLYLLGFSLDITEQIQLEQQFRQAQKMETVGHLTGGVAHDFNNVLMALQLNLEMVQERLAGDEEGSDALRVALNAVERGAALTGRLLAFSRKQPLQPATINVNTLVREMMRLLHRTLEEDLDVETVLAAGVWSIEIDPAQLENALINLAVNARDAMPDGGKLTIETANTRLDDEYARQYDEVRPGQYVMIAVSDTGTGMTADVLERAFDPFFTTKDVGKGSGLGLSMVYGFVKQSGGHVKIYSELGQGTTVKLYFPRTAMTAASPDRIDAALPIRSGKETVLLVEDDPSVRLAVRRSLNAFGYAVHSVGTGEDALQLVRDGLMPDLLLADVVLPGGMSGREVSDAIAVLAPSCRTLYMSGYTDNAIVHHGRLDVGVTLISKPFTRQTLAAKIREVLDAD